MIDKNKQVALITGITGQDGSYLAELLLEKEYIVHGVIRRSSSFNTERIDHLYNDPTLLDKKLFLHYGDLSDNSVCELIKEIRPDEIYNLAAQSHVAVSFKIPEYTSDINYMGVVRMLECIRHLDYRVKFYQASTSEMFGKSLPPQNESTLFQPQSPYAVSKVAAHNICTNYRNSYKLFICCGILFNHESPRRNETFVTRKIVNGLCKVKLGLQDCVVLGNIFAQRDWGWAPDYVEAMWLMMQRSLPDDYVIATGASYTVKEFIEAVLLCLNIEYEWLEHTGGSFHVLDKKDSKIILSTDSIKYIRPSDVDWLCGDYTAAKRLLGWKPTKYMDQIIDEMVKSDFEKLNRGQ